MPNFIQSGYVTFKTTLLIGALIITPVAILVARTGVTSAKPDTKVCVAAAWKANTSIKTDHGDCPRSTPAPIPTSTLTPTAIPTSSETFGATPSPTATVTQDPDPTATAIPSSTPTETHSPEPEVTATPIPTAASPSPEPTVEPSPTHSPDVTVSPTPVATAPVVPPAPDPIPIPPANLDPKTKEFMFCHAGSMHSNSFTGMMNGHHDRHADDIIPPIPFKFYGGWNWTDTNAKTYYNNCVPVK